MGLRFIGVKSITFMVLLLFIASGALPAGAQASPPPLLSPFSLQLQVSNQDAHGVKLEWPGAPVSAAAVTAALATLPTVRYQGYELPMQLVTLRLDAGVQSAALQLQELQAVRWEGALTPAQPLAPPVLDWEAPLTASPVEEVALPTAPLFVLRQGKVRGQTIAVVALSPLYQAGGEVKLATHVSAQVAHAATVDDRLFLTSLMEVSTAAQPPSPDTVNDLAPVNAAAATNAIKIIVRQSGMQQITGQALSNAGLNLPDLEVAKLHLAHNGRETPLEINGLVNDKLTAASTIRFYAPVAQDRWNLTQVYWLTSASTDGARMAVRTVMPAGAPGLSTVIEKGVWSDNKLYSSQQAGVDGDHWFHKEMRFDPARIPTATVTINNLLPPASGSAIYTLTLSTLAKAQSQLRVQAGGHVQVIAWHSAPDNVLIPNWSHTVQAPASAQKLLLTLLDGDDRSGLALDQVAWQQPAMLNFQGKGAHFSGVAGLHTYQWQGLPLLYLLYDVTDPGAPVSLTGATPNGFQDGPAARDYLLAGPGTLHEPEVQFHEPVVISAGGGADAIYIAPHEFHAALEPLVAHRQAQGYSVAVVDVADIYDAWSYGQVSAEAIRTFLRFAKSAWQPAPLSAVLVGDGTWDPHNYEKKANHINFIPPYVADVDPWLDEAACETCFAQLDGDDPLTGDSVTGDFFATDIWIGRFSVRTVQELTNLVDKIIRYETDVSPGAWRSNSVFLADNYVQSIDSDNRPIVDAAGDFATITDQLIHTVHPQSSIQRIYYDPYPQIADPTRVQTWRVHSAAGAKAAALNVLNAGAGLVTYNGHAHQWQWARFDSDPSVDGFLALYDTDTLTNNDRFFITLSMTCLTAQFHKPADSGTVLDERQLLNPNGGAVAVWGPSGLSVVHGHDALQHGFHRALWNAPPMTARLGELIEAGYTELLTKHACCQDALQTFLLLGDPLTPTRIELANFIYLPLADR